jgi:UDP-2-acetamido-3-amino-2,3-dideoxy-glucuronate N-acetyltransferase
VNVQTKIIPGHVHPQACIMQGAHVQIGCTIGARTRVWQFASVIRKAVIGEDCSIAAGACVDGGVVGHGSIVSHCAFINPGMVIGDRVFIGPFVAMCNDAWPRAHKDGFDIDALISGEFVTTKIEDGASIGAHATLLPGATIGADAMVAAGAVVKGNVPDNHLYLRDGRIVPIDPKRPIQRMRSAA